MLINNATHQRETLIKATHSTTLNFARPRSNLPVIKTCGRVLGLDPVTQSRKLREI